MRKRFYAWLGLCMLLCGCFVYSGEVKAEEKIVVGEATNALQGGGLLEEEGYAAPMMSSASNIKKAKAAIVDAAKNLKDSVKLSSYKISRYDMENMFAEVLNENPRLFYLGRRFTYDYDRYGYVVHFNLFYADSKSIIPRKLKEYEHEVNKILSQMPVNGTTFEKILFINEYIALNCEYYEEAVNNRNLDAFDAYNVFVDKKAVCQGYALAVEELMDRLGIPCELVTSQLIDHAWNMVQLNGRWYHMDVTWNDPIHDKIGRVSHFHLLKSYYYFSDANRGNHQKNGYTDYVYTGGLTNYSATSTYYDTCFWDSINTPFVYLNGYWYNIVQSTDPRYGNLNRYYFTTDAMILSGTLMTTSDMWRVWNDSSRYWYYYGECIVYNGALYYSTPMQLRRYNFDGTYTVIHTLQSDERPYGNIYGFSINPYGEVQIGLGYNLSDQYLSKLNKVFHYHQAGAPATCMRHQTCTICDKIMTPASGHGSTYKKEIAATFAKAKQIETYCKDCHALISTKSSGKKLSCKKGKVYKVGSYRYKIISNKTNGKGTVAFHGLSKNVKKVVIGNTVTIKGVKFKITEISAKALYKKTKITAVTIGTNLTKIGKEAFYGAKKLKSITINSAKLKSVGKNAAKKVHKKIKIYVPSNRINKYKKLFKGKV